MKGSAESVPAGTGAAFPRRRKVLPLLLQSLAAAAACACLLTSLRVAFSSDSDSTNSLSDRESAVTDSLTSRAAAATRAYGGGDGTNSSGAVPVRRYAELRESIAAQAGKVRHDYYSTYNKASVVADATSWFQPRKICKGTCCAETVAVSLRPDDRQIINTLDGLDLADVRLQHYRNPTHVRFAGDILNEAMLPCLQPGTVVHLDNHNKIVRYFFGKVRKRITVHFVLLTTETDGDSPFPMPFRDSDPLSKDDLLLRWYGTNPKSLSASRDPKGKFAPMPLGLSKHHPQDKYLSKYLDATNYTNPFLDKSRWTSFSRDVTVDDIFVKFGVNRLSQRRKIIVDALCGEGGQGNRTTSSSGGDRRDDGGGGGAARISCGTHRADPGDIYSEASTYLFGMSPPGAGYDCYRTYELLLLGIIPIVESRRPASDELFRDLPVVQVDDAFDERVKAGPGALRERIVKAAGEYVRSDAFRNGNFERGWERLFLRYWRRRILRDAGREKDILLDDEGTEYYQVWRYTPTHNGTFLCSEVGNCMP